MKSFRSALHCLLTSGRHGLELHNVNEDEGSSAGSSMISLNPAEITNSPKLRAVKLRRGQDGKLFSSPFRSIAH